MKRDYESFKKEKCPTHLDSLHVVSPEFSKLKQIMLTDDLLFKNEQYVVSPVVFCKKVPLSSLEGASPRLIILENLLRIVCQSYYKSEFSIGNLIQELDKKGTQTYRQPLVSAPISHPNRLNFLQINWPSWNRPSVDPI